MIVEKIATARAETGIIKLPSLPVKGSGLRLVVGSSGLVVGTAVVGRVVDGGAVVGFVVVGLVVDGAVVVGLVVVGRVVGSVVGLVVGSVVGSVVGFDVGSVGFVVISSSSQENIQ